MLLTRLSEGTDSSVCEMKKWCIAGLIILSVFHMLIWTNVIEPSFNRNTQLKPISHGLSNRTVAVNNSLCHSNPYIGSLDSPLPVIALQSEEWLDHLDDHIAEARKPDMLEHSHQRFFPFFPNSTCATSCIGGPCGDDESKIICGLEHLKHDLSNNVTQCVVYSIGGNNQWSFEMELLNRTSCLVHTFDCTGPESRFEKPQDDRLTFHHICLGSTPSPKPVNTKDCNSDDICGPIMTLQEIQSMLGHYQIDLLKMDVEGFEWPIFESWPELNATNSLSGFVYPMQILVEVHYQTQFPVLYLPNQTSTFQDFRYPEDIVRLQAHLLRMGYAVMVYDPNIACPHCAELTLIRFRC